MIRLIIIFHRIIGIFYDLHTFGKPDHYLKLILVIFLTKIHLKIIHPNFNLNLNEVMIHQLQIGGNF